MCQDYAFVTVALLRAAGIEARIAVGQGDGSGGWGGHAWVEANVDGRWVTMDPTWDAGGQLNGQFVFRFQTKYFDPDPDVFKLDHRFEKYSTD